MEILKHKQCYKKLKVDEIGDILIGNHQVEAFLELVRDSIPRFDPAILVGIKRGSSKTSESLYLQFPSCNKLTSRRWFCQASKNIDFNSPGKTSNFENAVVHCLFCCQFLHPLKQFDDVMLPSARQDIGLKSSPVTTFYILSCWIVHRSFPAFAFIFAAFNLSFFKFLT